MKGSRALRLARDPARSASVLLRRLAAHPGLPAGQVAQVRRLLRKSLQGTPRALVIGTPEVVRRALPAIRLDVVGTDPDRTDIDVVSEADGPGSLPRRWQCVVVTEVGPPPERLEAAASACMPGGVVAVLNQRGHRVVGPPGSRVELLFRSRRLELRLARVLG